jgi:glycosyltransferase involved in cell wall biosynthesis
MFELFPEYRTISRSREWKWYRWQCCRQVDRLLAIREQTAGDLRRLWRVPAERIRVVPLGLEPSSPAPRSQPTGPDFILSYFNLEPRKNLLGLVRAWKQVHQKHPQFSLRLFGRAGWSEQREKEFYLELDREGLRSSVTILGYVNDADLAVLYRQCALFVYPSFYEGFGLPIVEAMRQGACVLAHEADPMADLIGEAGAVTDFGSESLIAEKLDDLLRDGEQRRVLAEKARDRSLVFSWQNMARGTLEVYEELLGPVGSGVAR